MTTLSDLDSGGSRPPSAPSARPASVPVPRLSSTSVTSDSSAPVALDAVLVDGGAVLVAGRRCVELVALVEDWRRLRSRVDGARATVPAPLAATVELLREAAGAARAGGRGLVAFPAASAFTAALPEASSDSGRGSYWSTRQTADRWGLSSRMVRLHCQHGRIPGAHHGPDGEWLIPSGSSRPRPAARRPAALNPNDRKGSP